MDARVLWVTNLAAPYRRPLWAALERRWSLKVGLLESGRRLTRDTALNRGADWRGPRTSESEIIEYRTMRLKRGEDRHYTLADVRAIRDVHRCDVLLLGGWDSPAYFQLLAQAKAGNTPVVGFHESTLASQSRSVGRIAEARSLFFRGLDCVVVPGPAAGEAVERMGVASDRIFTGFNAVDVDAFRARAATEPHTGHRFLYVGQLIPRKNVEAILTAFSQVAESSDMLTLIGRGELKDSLEDLAHQLGVAPQVRFVDYVPNSDLPAQMAEHDTLVLASHVEVWGLVVNEALAAGLQVVVTSNCGVSASVKDMPGVVLCAPDAADLPVAMRRARDEYVGHITDPPILQFTPQRFADTFSDAFDRAIALHQRKK